MNTMSLEFDRRYAFYLDTAGTPQPISVAQLDRLHRGTPDAALPTMAGHRVRFAVFHVERFTSPPRIVVEYFPYLPLDAHGHLDQPHHSEALQADVDALEAPDETPPKSSDPATSWSPDALTRRRLLNALRDLRRPTPLRFLPRPHDSAA